MTHETVVRLGVFVGVLVAMAVAEACFPRRPRRLPRSARWPAHLGIVALGAVVVRLLGPLQATAVALAAESRGWGLLARVDAPPWAEFVGSFLALDFAVYLQHVAFHKAAPLWRLHKVHHADVDFDATTGVRFHPVEIGLSMVVKSVVVCVLGAPVAAVAAFEIALNATSLFNHGNLALPERLDGVLRLFLVTPDMHRVHHSVEPKETDSNFGFCVPWWDRICGTYRQEPEAGRMGMVVGLGEYQDEPQHTLAQLLTLPFRRR